MHYSQNDSILAEWDAGGPHQALLRSDCVGCHSGTNTGIAEWDTPYVHSSSGAPTYNTSGTESDTTTLAGGSFYWVNQPASGSIGGDAAGHNVAGISTADATLLLPPGFDGGRAAADSSIPGGGTWTSGQQVTCAGTYGCHGTHAEGVQTIAIHGAHHGNLGGDRSTPGTSPATGYRFLVGIAGFEDPDWEFRPTTTEHNQYKGFDRASMDNTDDSTISSLCARCHGAYHSGASNVGTGFPWLRHPTDYDMGNLSVSSDYRNYGASGVNDYVPAVPVASETVTSVKSSVTFANDTIITCVTCHRAHGSKYYKAMRWDYAGSVTGGLCSECHSSKD
jgi:predicted CXXCH cytochrome family protein